MFPTVDTYSKSPDCALSARTNKTKTTIPLAMSDLPLKQLDPQVPSNKSPDGTVHVKKRDRFRKFLGIQKSTSKEVKHKPSNQSLDVQPLSEQSTRLPSVTSQVSSYHSGDNQSVFLSTALENKPLPAPPAVDRACMDDIFVDNISKPVIKTVLPRLQERIESTEQLIYCGSLLLQDTLSSPVAVPGEEMTTDTIMVMQKPTLDKAELDWLEEVKRDPMEQDRLHWLVTRMVDEFVANTIKDSTEIAEIVSLTPILQKETYHRLLASLIKDLDAARILNVALLQGLVQLIEGASPGFLEDDDLVRTLAILLRRLQATHKPSSEYVYQMTIAISRLLDIMVNVIVKDVNRTQDYQPLLAALNDLKNTADLKLHFQVHYALQASQYIPDDESTLRTVLRFAGGITIAALGIATLCKLNPANLFSSLNTLQQAAGQSFKVAKSILEGLEASQQGRFRAMQGLLKGIRAGTKYEWYLALLAARSFVREGRLDDFKKTVCEAPCRDEHFFQLGVCQILGEIAVDPLWSPHIRQQAIDFLGALFRNGTGWKQHSDVKQWIDTSLTHLSMLQDPTVSNHARLVLKDLGRDQASITTTSANKSYLLSCRLSLPELSLVLSRVQHIPYVEYELNALKIQRLEEVQQQVYIPPLAKANLQARDDDLFPLMEKVQEFLTSEREVMLILGDSGAGKSTFNRHLEHHLWTNYKKNDPIPLFINLPAIDRPDLDMVIKQLQIHNFTEDQVQGMKQHRQFILICDGYDESQLIANLHRTNRLNQQDQWRAKMVISCRSQFLGPVYLDRFVPHSTDHYKPARLDLFQEVVIAPFSKNQVQDYVARYVPLEPRPWVTEDYMQMLATIPNLMDLVKNPFLLTLALEALPGVTEGQKDLSAITVTRVQLYDHFVDMWLSVNMRRLQDSVLSTQDREMLNSLLEADFISRGVSYSTNLAIAIFEKQDGNPVVRYIHLDDDSTWKAEYFGPQPKARLLRESSPLTRTGNLHRFVHRSMLEYFLSRAVFDPSSFSDTDEYSLQLDGVPAFVQSLDHRTLLFQQDLLTEPSVIGFLCERVKQHPGFEKQLLLIIDKSVTDPTTATAAANAMTILVRAGVQFNGADLRGIRIPKADLSDGQFDSAQLQNADLTSVNFSRSWLRQADLSGAKMNGIRFGELPSLKDKLYAFLSAYSPDGKLLPTDCTGLDRTHGMGALGGVFTLR
ncbi:hypothetical protein BGW39_011844 [Mortierella sp. 14UC]|nr:hypothetical protein BGW39_011844 [Mortierella sp. 14UC]